MNISDHNSSEWWDERIEAYVDGTLATEDASRMKALLADDVNLAAEVRLAENIRDGFRSMSEVECPEALSRSIQREVHGLARRERLDAVIEAVTSVLRGHGRFAVAAVVVVLAATSVFLLRTPDTMADAEVAQALEDVKWTLALVSNVGSETADVVRNEAIEPLVLDPLGHTFKDAGNRAN